MQMTFFGRVARAHLSQSSKNSLQEIFQETGSANFDNPYVITTHRAPGDETEIENGPLLLPTWKRAKHTEHHLSKPMRLTRFIFLFYRRRRNQAFGFC